jgi:hypothetical protein
MTEDPFTIAFQIKVAVSGVCAREGQVSQALVVISRRLARARNPCGAMGSSSVAGISKSRPLLQRASNMLNCRKGKNSSIGAAMCHHPLITIPVEEGAGRLIKNSEIGRNRND